MTNSDDYPALDIRDLTRMRAIITIELGCTQPWDHVLAASSDTVNHDAQRWQSGPLRMRSFDQQTGKTFVSNNAQHSAVLNPEYGKLLVDDSIRQHLFLPTPQIFLVEETHVLQLEAFDLLHVRTTPGGGFRALLSIHAHVLTPDQSHVSRALRHRHHVFELAKRIRALLATEGSLAAHTLYFPGHEKDPEAPHERPPFPPPPFLSLWIPPQIVAHACASPSQQRSALAALGWQWTQLPGRDGVAFGEQKIDEADAQLEVLSQSWAISVAEFAVAYLPREDKGYAHQAITHMFTSHNDVCVLVLRTRLLLKHFSLQAAELARSLNTTLHTLASSPTSREDVGLDNRGELAAIVDQAIRLDAAAAAFLASTWGRDVSARDHLDILLGRLQAVGYLEADISHLTEQTRWLRDSTQTLIEREEHRLDQKRAVIEERRQHSAHTLNWVLGVLTIAGVPLAAVVNLFASDKLPDFLPLTSEGLLLASVAIPSVLILPIAVFRLARWLKAKWTRTGTEAHCD